MTPTPVNAVNSVAPRSRLAFPWAARLGDAGLLPFVALAGGSDTAYGLDQLPMRWRLTGVAVLSLIAGSAAV